MELIWQSSYSKQELPGILTACSWLTSAYQLSNDHVCRGYFAYLFPNLEGTDHARNLITICLIHGWRSKGVDSIMIGALLGTDISSSQYRGFLVLTDRFGLQINCILADMPSQNHEHFPTHGSREEMIAGSCTQRFGCNFRTLPASPLMETAQSGRLPMTPRARRAAPAGAVWTR